MPLTVENKFNLEQYAQLFVDQLSDEDADVTVGHFRAALSLLVYLTENNWTSPPDLSNNDPLIEFASIITNPQAFASMSLQRVDFDEARFILCASLYVEIAKTEKVAAMELAVAADALRKIFNNFPQYVETRKNSDEFLKRVSFLGKKLENQSLRFVLLLSILSLALTVTDDFLEQQSETLHQLRLLIEEGFLCALELASNNLPFLIAGVPICTFILSCTGILERTGMIPATRRQRVAHLPSMLLADRSAKKDRLPSAASQQATTHSLDYTV